MTDNLNPHICLVLTGVLLGLVLAVLLRGCC